MLWVLFDVANTLLIWEIANVASMWRSNLEELGWWWAVAVPCRPRLWGPSTRISTLALVSCSSPGLWWLVVEPELELGREWELCPEPLDSLLLPVRAILPINRSKSDCFCVVWAESIGRVTFLFLFCFFFVLERQHPSHCFIESNWEKKSKGVRQTNKSNNWCKKEKELESKREIEREREMKRDR